MPSLWPAAAVTRGSIGGDLPDAVTFGFRPLRGAAPADRPAIIINVVIGFLFKRKEIMKIKV